MKKGGWILGVVFAVSGCSDLPYAGMPEYNRMLPEEIDGLIETGLKAWRTSGSIEMGASCSGCHAPDALDLAYFDYSDFTLRRRGSEHVSRNIAELNASQLEDIVNLVHALRVKHSIEPKPNREFLPFQPGSVLLPGNNGPDKDDALAAFFANESFRFATVPLLSRHEALLQKEEWKELDIRQIPLGIPLSLWSEDPFYGTEHASLADWLPALPVIPKPGFEESWFEFQDRYLRYPTDDNLLVILDRVGVYTKLSFDGNGAELMQEKYKAMLIAQHYFRLGMNGGSHGGKEHTRRDGLTEALSPVMKNVFQEIAERACYYQMTLPELPDDLLNRYGPAEHIADQMKLIHEKWLWKSWLADPFTFYLRSGEGETCEENTDLPLHLAYRAAKSSVGTNFGPVRHQRHFISVVFPVTENPGPAAILIIENSYRMFLYLMTEDLAEINDQISASEIEVQKRAVKIMAANFERFKSDFLQENRILADRVLSVLENF